MGKTTQIKVSVSVVPSESFDYLVYRTKSRGWKFEVLRNVSLDTWVVFARKGDGANPKYGKRFSGAAAIARHYVCLKGFDDLIQSGGLDAVSNLRYI